MPSDFITLICPACGGKLEFTANTISLKCPSCGVEHIIRNNSGNYSIEAFARCPACLRNDEVKKVTSIVANQTQNMNGVIEVPVRGTQSTVLARKLQLPAKPVGKGKPGRPWRYLLLLFAASGLIQGFVYSFGLGYSFGEGPFFAQGIGMSIEGGLVFLWFIYLNNKAKKNAVIYEKEIKRIREQQIPIWEKAVERWKKLYYCSRCDLVFVPGENTSEESDKINDYVYRNLHRTS